MKRKLLQILSLCLVFLFVFSACDTNEITSEELTSNNDAITTDSTTEEPVEEPTTEAPTTEAPTTEAPTTEKSTEAPTDESPTDEPPTDEPPTDEPPTDEPPTDEPPTDEPPAECEHDWIDADCDTPKTCSKCHETDGDSLGHDEQSHAAQTPTCTEGGWDAYVTCSRCNYTTFRELGALGHDEQSHDEKKPTCTEGGWNAYVTCSRCSYTTYEELGENGHTPSDWITDKDATAEEDGSKHKECTVCNDILETSRIPALKHNYVSVVTPPNCTERGYTTHTCSECGDSYIDNYTDPNGHSYTSWRQTKAPKCEEKGEEKRSCTNCAYFETRETRELGHAIVNHTERKPTCQNGGWDAYVTCSRCNYSTFEALDALGHDKVTDPAVDATCTEDGLTEGEHCSRCSEIFVEQTVIHAKGHDEQSHAAQTPTCTEGGWDAYVTCSRCNYSTFEALDALGHNKQSHDEQKPTCTEGGWNAYETCSRCDYTTYEGLGSLGHNEVIDPSVDATCTEDGLTEGKHCSRCSEIILKQTVISSKGHKWTDATCTVPRTCSECKLTDGEALGHIYDWSRSCERCDYARPAEIEGLDIDSSDVNDIMQNIFLGDTVYNETVMFIDKGETKSLLFPIDEIVSVQSFNGDITYVEGRDYTIIDGKLHIPTTSTINIITSQNYYNYNGANGQLVYEKYNGLNVPVYWLDANGMTMWQVRVTYKHSSTWGGFKQASYAKQYEGLIKKLMAGEDVTFIFYGDSITCGASSSWYYSEFFIGKNDLQWSYSMLFTQALADMFGYTIHFIDCSSLQPGMIKAPPANYVGGTRGTITYINPSVGGWTSENGLSNFDTFVKPYIQQYGCDLLGVAFGMNDAKVAPATTANNVKEIYRKAMALDGDFYGLVISTMLPNNKSTNGWFGNQQYQETELEGVVNYLNANGVGAGIARVTSVTKSMLEIIDFRDYTGNNINHPNDFMQRIYAQTCLQAFIGYENMK